MKTSSTFHKKTVATVALASASIMLLAGCTQDEGQPDASNTHLADQTITILPEWDVRELQPGAWYLEDGEPVPTAPAEISNPENIPGLTDDVFLTNWVKFLDDDSGCQISGRVITIPSDTAGRGDDYNTREYLFSRVSTEDPYGTIQKETINEIDYLTMEGFVAPSEDGMPDWNHRMAARAFSGVLDIEGMTIEGDTTGPHGSDLLKGQALAYIDLACEKAEDVTEERWKAGVEFFNLILPDQLDESELSETRTVEDETGESVDEPVEGPVEGPVAPVEDAPIEEAPPAETGTE